MQASRRATPAVSSTASRLSAGQPGSVVVASLEDDQIPVVHEIDESVLLVHSAYLFRSPANARRLLDAYDRARAGKTQVHELDRSDEDD